MHSLSEKIALPQSLDSATRALILDIVQTLPERHPDLLAILLYGSVARGEERSLEDPDPSDVDLLTIFDTDDELVTVHQGYAISTSLVMAYGRHLDAPRQIQVMIASRTLGEWDATFVANVARDGIPLLVRGKLPSQLVR